MIRAALIGLFLLTPGVVSARVENPILFLGEVVKNGTPGAVLTTDLNGKLTSGYSAGSVGEASATTTTTTSTNADAVMDSMTFTPRAGTYLLWFSTDLSSATSGAVVTISFYAGGSQIAASQRKVMPYAGGTLTAGSQRIMVSTNSVATVNGSQAIEIHWSTSSGTITAANRAMQYLRVN